VQQVNDAAAAANLQRELALLDLLEKKHRPGIVIQMPAPAVAPALEMYDDPPEQLSLIA